MVAAFASRDQIRSSWFIAVSGTVVVLLGWLLPNVLSTSLARFIASITAGMLTATMFPVIADGVTLYFGPYSAEVAKACSGMNSMFSLTALSVIYLRENFHRNIVHVLILVSCVLPVALLGNLGRVVLLVLVTMYVGDDFAQGLFHDVAGIFAFMLALVLLYGVDRLLAKLVFTVRRRSCDASS